MENNYWSGVAKRRLSRRRALAVAGAGATAAALLAACGGDDGGGDTAKDSSGTLTQAKDTYKEAKRGGILKDIAGGEPNTFDPANAVSPLNPIIKYTYGTLLKEQAVKFKPSEGKLAPDLAESWEVSPDGLQITMKIRKGAKWHNRPPVNARAIDVDDVLFSWQRYTEKSAFRTLTHNAVNPDAPILSLSAPDANTIVVKLKEPVVYAINFLASFGSLSGNAIMLPKETDTGFDPRREIIGHGPYTLSEVTPSVGYKLKRHEDYWDKDFNNFDGIDIPIIPEYATRISQFIAGNVHAFGYLVDYPRPEDAVPIKRQQPKINLYARDFGGEISVLSFGWLPEGKSPFLDERVRQAVSMSIDRDTWIDVLSNVSKFEAEGLPVETRWHSHLLADWKPGDWWLDPQGKDFGPNAKYFQYDLAEAKKMLTAAGHPSGFEVTAGYPVFPFSLQRPAEAFTGMAQELLGKINLKVLDYATEYIPRYRDGQGQYEGWAHHTVSGTITQRISAECSLASEFWSKGGVTFHGFSADGKNTGPKAAGDPELDRLLTKARLERDEQARRKLVHDTQRYLGKTMYSLYMPGSGNSFLPAWPAVSNYGVWHSLTQIWFPYQLWLDQTQPPFAG